ncbi:MAG: hypothetical protein NC218_02060 [Acetobacter sp.]|nr:hypothetical protein [Acetobacter sp.]
MGSFSWYRADRITRKASIQEGDSVRVLIPKEFGGGCIKGKYCDYGVVEQNGQEYDVYDLLAVWNKEQVIGERSLLNKQHLGKAVKDLLDIEVEEGSYTPSQAAVYNNRTIGIEIACYDDQMATLKYPLKIVSARNKCTYEECEGISYQDPDQGFNATDRYSNNYCNVVLNRERLFRERGIDQALATRGV